MLKISSLCLPSLIDQVQRTLRPLVLTRNGKSVAVVVDAGEFEVYWIVLNSSKISSLRASRPSVARRLLMKRHSTTSHRD